MANKISVFRRDSKNIVVNVSGTAAPINITGYTFFFTVKENDEDTDANAKISKKVTSHTDPTNGKTTITVGTADLNQEPKVYVYDVSMKDTSNNVTTLVKGDFEIIQDITIREV